MPCCLDRADYLVIDNSGPNHAQTALDDTMSDRANATHWESLRQQRHSRIESLLVIRGGDGASDFGLAGSQARSRRLTDSIDDTSRETHRLSVAVIGVGEIKAQCGRAAIKAKDSHVEW